MLPTWDDKFSVQYERVDRQHKRLFELASQAYNLTNRHISKEEITKILNSFFNYMKVHFKDEEQYMQSIGYPEIEHHKVIHQHIIHSLVELIKDIHNVNDMKEKLSVIAKNWLLEHILHEDMKIANWRKEMALKGKEIKVKEDEKFYYVCGCSEKVHMINLKTHKKIEAGAKFRCKKCNQPITYERH